MLLHHLRCLVLPLAFVALAPRAGVANPPPQESLPVADFFRHESFAGAVMSPSGKYVAATIKGGPSNRRGLVVFDANDLAQSKAIAYYANADVIDVRWVNDERLVFELFDFNETPGNQGIRPVYAIDRAGKQEPRALRWYSLHSTLNDDSDDAVFIRSTSSPWGKNPSTGLSRVSTSNAATKDITFGGPDSVRYWALDWRGNPRVAMAYVDGKSRMYWKRKADSAWTVAREWQTYANQHESPFPIGVDDRDRLYVVARESDAGAESQLYVVDMDRAPTQWRALVALKGYDFEGSLIWGDGGRVLGVTHLTDAVSITWFDAGMKEIQAAIDKLLPTTNNLISCGLCKDRRKILVYAWSDRQPGVTLLFDTESKALQALGRERPWIKPHTMARREFTRFAARDGLSIPVHVTRPPGQMTPGPAVVLVHGGPFVRGGTWAWDAESQFLASRGYTVIEPEFRGSTGFGYPHFRAGWKQWGLAMQDDVADATIWAVKQGFADASRVCIAGASYGGYAALMGLVRHGELYQCAISWAGVSDIDLIYESRWSNLPLRYTEYGMPLLVADQDKDAAQIRDTSPARQAAKIKRPVLLAHGGEDYRVPMLHAIKMRGALEKNSVPVEWLNYPDEGHGWMLETTRVDFWTRVEAFLKKHTTTAPVKP